MSDFPEPPQLPLYRQSQIFAREGIELDRSVLARWVGEVAALLDPVAEVLRRYVLDTEKLHGDDTPVPVLVPGTCKTKTGRFWTYVRDNRPAGDKTAPAVWFAYSPNRKGEHPQQHLAKFEDILQADAFAGFNALYQSGAIQEAPCLAHIRRKGFTEPLVGWKGWGEICQIESKNCLRWCQGKPKRLYSH